MGPPVMMPSAPFRTVAKVARTSSTLLTGRSTRARPRRPAASRVRRRIVGDIDAVHVIDEDHALQGGEHLLEDLQSLWRELVEVVGDAGDVAPWPPNALHESEGDGIRDRLGEDDGHRRGRAMRGLGRMSSAREDDVAACMEEIPGTGRQRSPVSLGEAHADHEVLAVSVAERRQPITQSDRRRCRTPSFVESADLHEARGHDRPWDNGPDTRQSERAEPLSRATRSHRIHHGRPPFHGESSGAAVTTALPAMRRRYTVGSAREFVARLNLTLLGGFEARIGSKTLGLPRKAEALLAYMALAPAATHTRSKLAALLWADASDDDARNNLRQVLFRTRRALGSASEIVTINGEVVGLDQAAVESDVATLRRVVANRDDGELQEAAALCRGRLLDGMDVAEPAFEEWLASEREAVHILAVRALLMLIEREETRPSLDGVVAAALKLLGLDPLQEPAHRALMRAYAAQGRRAGALRQYQICVDVLQRELEAEPEAETKALYRELLGQGASPAHAPTLQSTSVPAVGPGLGRPPLAGRTEPLGILSASLDDALRGGGRLIAVYGEAGVGKTRLVDELRTAAVSRGCLVLAARAYETEAGLPFALWVNAVRSADVVENRSIIEALGAEWRDALNPLFRDLLGRRRRGTVETENQLRMFEALARLLTTVAALRPLVIVLEDLQWADETSLRFLAFLGRRIGAARIHVVLTVRPEDAGRGNTLATVVSELRRDGSLLELTLTPLTKPEAVTLIESLAPRAQRPVPPAIFDRVWQMSEGNPFVIIETLRRVETEPWPTSAADLPLPTRVRQLVLDRVDRLSATARRLADVASVVGRDFEYSLVRRAGTLPPGEAAEGLEELVRKGIVRQHEDRFDFAHDRIRETVRGALLEPQRRHLHLAVATALEEMYASDLDDLHATLAAHYEQAREWTRAIDALRRASMMTAARGAFRESALLLEHALTLMPHVARDAEGLARAIDIRVELWDRVLALPDFVRGESCLLEAQALAAELKDERRAAFVDASLANHDMQTRNFARGRVLAEESLAVAERLGEEIAAARAAHSLAIMRYASGELEGAVDAFARGIEAAGDDPLTMFSVGIGLCHVHLRGFQGIVLAELGRFEEAMARVREALERAESVRNIFSMAFAHWALGRVLSMRGEVDAALASYEWGFHFVERYEIGLVRRMYMVELGYTYALVGRADAALALATQGPPEWSRTHVARSRALLAAGRATDAEHAGQEALAAARRTGEQIQEAAALLLLAEIHAGHGTPAKSALTYGEAALDIAVSLGLRACEVQCHRQLGELLIRAGESGRARQHLAAALALCREMGMTRWIEPTAAQLESSA